MDCKLAVEIIKKNSVNGAKLKSHLRGHKINRSACAQKQWSVGHRSTVTF